MVRHPERAMATTQYALSERRGQVTSRREEGIGDGKEGGELPLGERGEPWTARELKAVDSVGSPTISYE